MSPAGDPSTPAMAHFPVPMNPSLVNLQSGRRRSQSVPPQMPTFARRLENGKFRQISITSTPSGTPPSHHSTRPYLSYVAQPDLAMARRSATDPSCVALPPTHPSALGMMTQPSSPAPYAHIQPAVGHQAGAMSCKRPFHQHSNQTADSARPEPKRRNQRKKANSPLRSLAGGARAVLHVEPILENLRALLQGQFEEALSGRFEELEG